PSGVGRRAPGAGRRASGAGAFGGLALPGSPRPPSHLAAGGRIVAKYLPLKEPHPLRIDAISTGGAPPRKVNLILEFPARGEPIKYEMDKAAGTLVVDRF